MGEDRSVAVSDDDLVRAVAAGSQEALAILYDRHGEAIFRLAVRLTNDRGLAEEIVQETFLALWNRAELFEPTSGSLATWLRTIARNRAVDRLRAAARRPRAASPWLDPDPDGGSLATERMGWVPLRAGVAADPEAAPERAIELTGLRSALREALAGMPAEERRVILLAYQDGLSQSEIAGRLGWPLGTVKTRTRRALHRLRETLGSVDASFRAAVDPSFGVSRPIEARDRPAETLDAERANDRLSSPADGAVLPASEASER